MRFHLVDRITKIKKWESAVGIKNVIVGEFEKYNDTYSRSYSQALLCETLLQTVAWLIVKSSNGKKRPVVLSINEIEFFNKLINPGQIKTEVVLDEIQDDMVLCSGVIYFGELKILTISECLISLLDTNKLEEENETDTLIKTLYRGEL